MFKISVFALAITFSSLYARDFILDQNQIGENNISTTVNHLHNLAVDKLNEGAIVRTDCPGISEYILLPEAAQQTWILALYDFVGKTSSHYHNLQNQMVMPLEGKLTVCLDDTELTLLPGQYALIPIGAVHALSTDKKGTRMLILDMPGYDFPHDRLVDKKFPPLERIIAATENSSPFFVDQSIKLPSQYQAELNQFPEISPLYFKTKIQEGDAARFFVTSPDLSDRWNISFTEIKNSIPDSFHSAGSERIIVLNGDLFVKISGMTYHLTPGQSIRVSKAVNFDFWTSKCARLLQVSHTTS
ncbi:MAG TPA: cupin domain-containing protein [Rhabdochlamydiaceae bacterium]|nr:cupin domain-containing protein [Rhabdochlamydiaceae bacterium]